MPSREESLSRSSSKLHRRRRRKSIEYKPRSRSGSRHKTSAIPRESVTKRTRASSSMHRSSHGSFSPSPTSDLLESILNHKMSDRDCRQRDDDYRTPQAMENLRHYHSTTDDRSILSALLQSFWDGTARRIPAWVSPNVITVTGFVVGLTGPFIVLYYVLKTRNWLAGILAGCSRTSAERGRDTDVMGRRIWESAAMGKDEVGIPSWAWVWSAIALFTYMTLDAVDGKQARRLKASSPLGEFLDHGLDACMTFFVHMNLTIALGMPPWMAFLFMFEAMTGLFMCIWEQYTTGTFMLGYISAPTEGIAAAIVQLLFTGIYGRQFWSWSPLGSLSIPVPVPVVRFFTNMLHIPVFSVEGSNTGILKSIFSFVPVGSLCSISFLVFTTAWMFTVMMNVYHVCTKVNRWNAALSTVLPMVIPCVCNFWLYAAYPDLHDAVFPLFEMSFGFLIAISCVKMCIARLTQTLYRPSHLFYFVFVVLHCVFFVSHALDIFPLSSSCVKMLAVILALAGALSYVHIMISFPVFIKRYFQLDIFVLSRRYRVR